MTRWVGVEHELCLWSGDERVDFRTLIGEVANGLPTLDPGDPRARRLPSGIALTADGWEVELATPPLPIEGIQRLDALLRSERGELRQAVEAHGVTRITGFSTHLNVSVADDRVVEVGRAFLESCLLAVAAVTEPASSAGVFVRPRRGRLEVGGEYVEGRRLIAALTLMAACVHGLEQGSRPEARVPEWTRSREKYGWFVPPEALDVDTFRSTWAWARPWCLELGLDPSPVDGALDQRHTGDECTFGPAGVVPAQALGPRDRPGHLSAVTEWLTWQHAVWLFTDDRGHRCRAVVPAQLEPSFLAALDDGLLDHRVRRMLRRGRRGRSKGRLLVNAQLAAAAADRTTYWRDVRPGALVPAERLPDGRVPRVSRRAARRDLSRDPA